MVPPARSRFGSDRSRLGIFRWWLRALALALFAASPASGQETRLANLSSRAQAGIGDNVLTAGFFVGGGASRLVVIRAVGPMLTFYGLDGAIADPVLTLFDSAGRPIAQNDNWNAADGATFGTVGAFAFNPGTRDAAIVTTLAPGSYTAQVTGVNNTTGLALVEIYEAGTTGGKLLNISVRAQVLTGADVVIPGIVISPGSGPRKLLVRAAGPGLGAYGLAGTLADPTVTLTNKENTVTYASNDNWESPVGPGASGSAALTAAFGQAGAFPFAAGSKDAALIAELGPGGYTIQVSGVANSTGLSLIEVYDLTPPSQTVVRPNASLYFAQLRPDPAATNSTASGYATLITNSDGTATVNVSFSNLSAGQTAAHLRFGAASDYVLNLPLGQVAGRTWDFSATGVYTSSDLINALNSGNISVTLASARFPNGELRGNFVATSGSQTFVEPAPPPALAANALTAPTQTDAARLLTQASFGPTMAAINTVTSRGITGWIDDQMALPMTSALATLRTDLAASPNPPDPSPNAVQRYANPANWHAAWWRLAATAPDQLRQRVAFALSELLVVGEGACDANFYVEMKAKYYDLLLANAFGSYRQLLEDVSLSPTMGLFLSHIRNLKADPVKGTAPDENYAREVQQLFTIGLVQLQPDGTLLLDSTGQPIPTYDQNTISETAKVFTGFTYAIEPESSTDVEKFTSVGSRPPVNPLVPFADTSAWLAPMRGYPAFHDPGEKRIVSLQQVAPARATPTIIPAGQTPLQDVRSTLTTLFNHPNTGPFVSRHLIQRLVTANPSPGYVYRVARRFADNGAGVRGDLGAVVRAILTDYEARSPAVIGNFGYGKIKEPLVRLTGMLRALAVSAPNGRFLDGFFGDPRTGYFPANTPFTFPIGQSGQSPLGALTVFNFFSPTFAPPGAMAAAGIVSPELELLNAHSATMLPNFLTLLLYRDTSAYPQPAGAPSPYLAPNYAEYLPLARDTAALVDRVNLIFCANQMSSAARTIIARAVDASPTATDLQRIQTAVHLAMLSPDGATQK